MRKAPPLVLFALFALSQSTESAYTTSMPQMAFSLNATHSEIQATSSIYFYGFAFGIFCLGGLSDIIGRKKVVLIGLGLFFIANLLIFSATNIHQLTILRFIQAFGASVGSVGAQAIARDVYKGPELSKLYASLAAGIAIVPSISSFIAGNILQYFGWREVFFYLMGISLLLLMICTIFLQETYDFQKNKTYPDYKGVLYSLIQDKKVLSYGFIIGVFNGIMFGLYIEAPFIFIENLHMQSSDYGLIILLQGLSAVLGGIICRKLQIYRVDIDKIKKTAFLLSILSCSLLLITGRLWDLEYIKDLEVIYFVTICIMMQSFSYAMIMPLVLRCALEDYTKTNGTAGSIFGTYYYALVATMNIIITQLHDTSILKVTIFFLLSSISAFAIHYLMQK